MPIGQSRRGAGLVGDPLVTHVSGSVVAERVDEDLADALVPEPQPPLRRLVAAVDAVRGVAVVAPVDDQLGVLESVLEHVVLLGHAQPPVEAEGMGGSPVPAFPAIRVVEDVGEADEAEEPGPRSGPVAHVAPVVVRGGPGGDGLGAVGLADADHLARHQVEGLVPAYALVRRFAPVLRVTPARAGGAGSTRGVEVHPLHGVRDAVVGVDPRPLGECERGHAGLARRRILLVVHLDGPRGRVGLVKDQRPDLGYLSVLDVDPYRAPRRCSSRRSFLPSRYPFSSLWCPVSSCLRSARR